MLLKKLKEDIDRFKSYFDTDDAWNEKWVYDHQLKTVNSWQKDYGEFDKFYDQWLKSPITTIYWKDLRYQPKEVMLRLIRQTPDFAFESFKELYNETIDIEIRIGRFQFYAEQLLEQYKKANPKSIVNNHYQDNRIVSFYLASLFPFKYTYFDERIFNRYTEELKCIRKSDTTDIVRHFKLSKIVYKYLIENEEVFDAHSKRLGKSHAMINSLWLVHEFLKYIYKDYIKL